MKTKELKNIAPKLYELKKLNSGFKVPKRYFENVESAIYLKVITDSTENETPFKVPNDYFETIENKVINSIKSNHIEENNFSIPDNYFNTVEDRVFEKIKKEPKVISLKERFTKTFIPMAVAASLLLFITLQLFNDKSSNDLLANLETSEIENWIDNGDLELNSFEIASVYEDTDFENLEINQINDENLIEYLNDIDIESLEFTN